MVYTEKPMYNLNVKPKHSRTSHCYIFNQLTTNMAIGHIDNFGNYLTSLTFLLVS
jgi:hypothetical protein